VYTRQTIRIHVIPVGLVFIAKVSIRDRDMKRTANKSVVATADNVSSSLRSGHPLSAVPHITFGEKIGLELWAEQVA